MTVIIGMDPHKRSATIEVVDERGRVLAVGRYGTDKAGYADMLAAGRRHPDRVWAVGDDLDAVANRLDEAVAARDKDYLRTRPASGGVVDLGKRRSPGR